MFLVNNFVIYFINGSIKRREFTGSCNESFHDERQVSNLDAFFLSDWLHTFTEIN
ncbi:hypothetical protein D3C80_2169500 [compost metagenome]